MRIKKFRLFLPHLLEALHDSTILTNNLLGNKFNVLKSKDLNKNSYT